MMQGLPPWYIELDFEGEDFTDDLKAIFQRSAARVGDDVGAAGMRGAAVGATAKGAGERRVAVVVGAGTG
ncbi:unnamed protein product, partial [Ectocarpus sp. 12 AP-2014]